MNKKIIYLGLLLTIAICSSFSFAEEQETGFYAIESNGDTITLTPDADNILSINKVEVTEAEISRNKYRVISKEEAEFIKEVAKKSLKSNQ
ncbi:hypothetical protein N8878_08645 [Psychromonas sp.]|nr:hypothetical protein [Psychromonas sp.]